MKIKKGTRLIVRDRRKGKFEAEALRDFDTNDEWYPITPLTLVAGLTTDWEYGDEIPCRNGLATVEVKEDEK